MNVAETARKALEILDRDGWCKGALTHPGTGAHCIAGAANMAMFGDSMWKNDDGEFYESLAAVIREQYPGWREFYGGETFYDRETLIVYWNNAIDIHEDDVRLVLEKLAAR